MKLRSLKEIISILLACVLPTCNLKAATVDNLNSQIGQLLITHVDGYQSQSAIHPLYQKTVRDLNLSGVLYQTPELKSAEALISDINAIQKSAPLPVLVSADYIDVLISSELQRYLNIKRRFYDVNKSENSVNIGLGFESQMNGWNWRTSCPYQKTFLHNMLFRLHGFNTMLGPIIEHTYLSEEELGQMDVTTSTATTNREMAEIAIRTSWESGVIPTLKHFPYTPRTFDLHKENHDTLFDSSAVEKMIEIFRVALPKPSLVMSTHVFNSKVDSRQPVTLSKTWIDLLKNRVHPESLIMTDAIFMISKKDLPYIVSNGWPQSQFNTHDVDVQYVARAILAGHDLVLIEGHSGDIRRIYHGLLSLARSPSQIGQEFARRVEESYKRVVNFKMKYVPNKKIIKANASLVDRAIRLLYADDLCSNKNAFSYIKAEFLKWDKCSRPRP